MKRILTITLAIIIGTAITFAGDNTLTITKTSSTKAAVILKNVEPVAGLQFTIQASSNLVLQKPERSERTVSSDWTVASYIVNDTVVNVVIVSLSQTLFEAGAGTLLELAFAETDYADESAIALVNVKVANPKAEKVSVDVENIRWNNAKPIAEEEENFFELVPNYPNPFNPETRISYVLTKPAHVKLTVYDIQGREIECLVDKDHNAGEYTERWNALESRRNLASGIYFAQLLVDGHSVTQKMMLAK